MSDIRWQQSLTSLGDALERLNEALSEPLDKNDFMLDATIQRFEFSVELFWKTLKHLLASKGRKVNLPKEILQEAYASGWLDNESLWIEMLRDRNQTSHTYRHELALEIYQRIKHYYPAMRKTYRFLYQHFSEGS
ncbi:MAG: HI0074 family nucleotidyltransferase substrate-binding subunit [Waddliaceae bacterium]